MPNFFLKERQHTETTVVERILFDNNTDSGWSCCGQSGSNMLTVWN